jgi:hypothetical protein
VGQSCGGGSENTGDENVGEDHFVYIKSFDKDVEKDSV